MDNSGKRVATLAIGVLSVTAVIFVMAEVLNHPESYSDRISPVNSRSSDRQTAAAANGTDQNTARNNPRLSQNSTAGPGNDASDGQQRPDSWTARYIDLAAGSPDISSPEDLYSGEQSALRQQVVNQLLDQPDINHYLRFANFYTKADLAGGSGNSKAALRKYGNAVAEVFVENNFPNSQSADEIFSLAAGAKAAADRVDRLDQLDRFRRYFNSVRTGLAGVPAPSAAEQVHLNLLNSVALLERRVVNMLLIDIDPVRAALNAEAYARQKRLFLYSYDQLNQFLADSGVSFTQDEAGSQL